MAFKKVSEAVIKRLPRYYRHLMMLEGQGVERISSEKLAQQMRLNASQVRQDFNCFGGFGQQGYGYNVRTLLQEIKSILALDVEHAVIIVGAGNIGHALTNFEGFAASGFRVLALFDVNPALIGTEIKGKPVYGMEELETFIRENSVDIGVIAARRSAAQEIADRMVNAGIKGIWNFVPVDLVVNVPIENVHLNDSLSELSYKIEHDVLDD
ncbi:MAG: redox-sensing transcriptional repressor Rex [Clostridia bacterium]|nr:redox-sensing transcriptional repressor Rex [Clostridia bacterium]